MLRTPGINWASRWVGGMCPAAGVGGLAVRGADYAAHPTLEAALLLPPGAPRAHTTPAQAQRAWSDALGGAPTLLLRSPRHARSLLLRALAVESGEDVGLPVSAERSLVEAIKQHGAVPRFLPLDDQLELVVDDRPRVVVGQPIAGLGQRAAAPTWLDCADTLPDLRRGEACASVALFGLHLSANPDASGALLAFNDPALAEACGAQLAPEETADPGAALTQLERLAGAAGQAGLAARQRDALAEVWRGLHEAAGLPLLPLAGPGPLPHGVAVQVPAGCDVATFYAYVRAERTPVRWLPEVRPLHYAALREPGGHQASADHLARWLLVPVGPDYTVEEISHSILGIVKTADYLGVRWCTDPERAAEYASWMDELYGPGHDAYRPLFAMDVASE